MLIYRYSDYRQVIKKLVEERKKIEIDFSYSSLAKQAELEKTYLSKVLKGERDLNSDQMYQVAKSLSLKSEEIDYLLLLLEYSRTNSQARRSSLYKKISALQLQHRHISKHLKSTMIERESGAKDFNRYYFEPYAPIIHMILSLKRYAKDPKGIIAELGISEVEFKRCLKVLFDLELIRENRDGSIDVIKSEIHLPPDRELFRTQNIAARHVNTHQMFRADPSERVNFNMTFTANESTRRSLHELFLNFLRAADKLIEAAPEENVYQMGFELFPWLKS